MLKREGTGDGFEVKGRRANGDWSGRCIFNERPSWKTNLNRLLIRAHSIRFFRLLVLRLSPCGSLESIPPSETATTGERERDCGLQVSDTICVPNE